MRGFDNSAGGVATVSYPNGIATSLGGQMLYFNSHRGVMRGGVMRVPCAARTGGPGGPSSDVFSTCH